MKKNILLLSLLFFCTANAQVVINRQASLGINASDLTPLNTNDLELRGNLKIQKPDALCYSQSSTSAPNICPEVSPLYIDRDNGNLVTGNIPKIFQRIVYYFKVSESGKDDFIENFDTKINSSKYTLLLGSNSLIISENIPVTNITSVKPSNTYAEELKAVKRVSLSQSNGTWKISANYNSTISNGGTGYYIWKIEVLAMNKSFIAQSVLEANGYKQEPVTISRDKLASNVGIGTDYPTNTLDINGKVRMKFPKDVSGTSIENIAKQQNSVVLFGDISKNATNPSMPSNTFGTIRVGNPGEKIAIPIRLKIVMKNSADYDYIKGLKLGINPNLYTVFLTDTQYTCPNPDTNDFSMKFIGNNRQPAPVSNVNISGGDWVLVMDYNESNPVGTCGTGYDPIWLASLFVFKNSYIQNISSSSSAVSPINLQWNEVSKSYTGSAAQSPLP